MASSSHHYPVAIVGAGQAGLSMSWYLTERGIRHVVFEKHTAGHAWRKERWDSFCLVTPNWQCQLPGYPYKGNDPDGFMLRDEIVAYIDGFRKSFNPPVREGVAVTSVRGLAADGFRLYTSYGIYTADQVVVATGGYHTPIIPPSAKDIASDIVQIHSSEYRNPQALPAGAVLVVGSGQSGAQIAEDLYLAGRKVHLCVGDAPRVARRYRGKDVVKWLDEMNYYDMPVTDHPLREGVRDKTNHYVTGRDGGRDIDLRDFARQGMELYGRLEGVRGETLLFGKNLEEDLDHADLVSEGIKNTIDKLISKHGLYAPMEPRYNPLWVPDRVRPELDVRKAGITSIVWCIGFRTDFSWVNLPAFNTRGEPHHIRGVSVVPGLYFLGLQWLYTWGSGRFSGVSRDAGHLAANIVSYINDPASRESLCPAVLEKPQASAA